MDLANWRSEINELDQKLLELLNRRAAVALKVGESKQSSGLNVCDHTREREVIERMCASNPGPLDERAIVELYRAIIHESRRIQTLAARPQQTSSSAVFQPEDTDARVAFQGEPGAFSEEAAATLLGEDITLVPRPTFDALFSSIEEGVADLILAPIENSLAGFVHASYDHLLDSKLQIVAEVIIHISHCLIGCQGSSFDQITAVESHPVALEQCRRFFATNPQIRRIATEDTAGSVARVLAQGDPTHAAIAGRRAAEKYDGQILREHLEDSSENYTRFLLLTPATTDHPGGDKLSLVIELPHQPGALHDALEPFARRDIDLLKIEGRPVKGRPWEYCFYLDLRGSSDDAEVIAALGELRERRVEVRMLGSYLSASVPAIKASEPAVEELL
jgi:prephenate dehydratase/chorismate mutase